MISSRVIKDRLKIPVSAVTTRRRLCGANLSARSPPPRKVPLFAREHVNRPKENWRTILCTDESNIVPFFGSMFVRAPQNTELKPQWSMAVVQASWYGDSLPISLGLCIAYKGSRISLPMSKYFKRSRRLMPKRKRLPNGCSSKRTTSKTPVSEQHLRSRPIKWKLWSGPAPNAWTLIPLNTCGLTSKNAVAEVNVVRSTPGWNTCWSRGARS